MEQLVKMKREELAALTSSDDQGQCFDAYHNLVTSRLKEFLAAPEPALEDSESPAAYAIAVLKYKTRKLLLTCGADTADHVKRGPVDAFIKTRIDAANGIIKALDSY